MRMSLGLIVMMGLVGLGSHAAEVPIWNTAAKRSAVSVAEGDGAIGLQLGTGYTVAFIIYQFGTLITEGHLGVGFIPGLIAVLCMAAAVVLIGKRIRSHFDEEYALHQAIRQGAKA